MTIKKKVNWEKLAKQLQKALEKEIKEHEELQESYAELHNSMFVAIKKCIKNQGVIEYLEEINGNDPV